MEHVRIKQLKIVDSPWYDWGKKYTPTTDKHTVTRYYYSYVRWTGGGDSGGNIKIHCIVCCVFYMLFKLSALGHSRLKPHVIYVKDLYTFEIWVPGCITAIT